MYIVLFFVSNPLSLVVSAIVVGHGVVCDGGIVVVTSTTEGSNRHT